jgi:hypothetical protein
VEPSSLEYVAYVLFAVVVAVLLGVAIASLLRGGAFRKPKS